MTEIGALLSNQNPQWSDNNYVPPEKNWPVRKTYRQLQAWQNKRFIIALTGLRRLGKSTLLKQIMAKLFSQGKSHRCLYFSFEKIQLKLEPLLLAKIINFYLENILLEKVHQVKERVYFFLDEVQNIPAWQEIVKGFYDQNENFKFFLSGSNSLFIKKKSQESLAGRLVEIRLYPLSFNEYLEWTSPSFILKPKDENWLLANLGLVNGYFEKYLRFGQFPEIITQKLNPQQAEEYLESIEEKITHQDLPRLFPIKHPEILTLILNQLKTNPGQRVEYDEVAKNAALDQRTISKYFDYLQKGFLLSLCRNFGKKPLKSLRIARKAYLISSNLCSSASISALVENYIYNLLQQKGYAVYFQKDKEIDFIAQKKDALLACEVKFQNEIKKEDSKNLRQFLKRNQPSRGFLITKNLLKVSRPITCMPACLAEFYLTVTGS